MNDKPSVKVRILTLKKPRPAVGLLPRLRSLGKLVNRMLNG